MAYTYDDFTKAATDAGVLESFDANDLDYAKKYPEFGLSMVSLKRDLGNAKTDEQKLLASEAMNQLRKNYGSYWTGENGNRSYAASFGSKIGDTMKKIEGYGDFEYDPDTDPTFSSFKKTYLREGDRAAANALGQSAAATGGIPSSYAQIAAQQAANYYAGKVADAIPTLREQALDEWNNGLNVLRNDLAMYQGQDETDYKRYLDMINAEYQRERDAVADAQKELANALQIYELTGAVTGPLKGLVKSAVSASGGGGGGGSAAGSVSGSGRTAASNGTGVLDGTDRVSALINNAVNSIINPGTKSGQTPSLYGVNNASTKSTSSGRSATRVNGERTTSTAKQ